MDAKMVHYDENNPEYSGGQKCWDETFPVILVKIANSSLPPQTMLNFKQNA